MVDWDLYVITSPRAAGERPAGTSQPLTQVVRAAVAGGATVVQLRAKSATTRELIQLGRALHAITRQAEVPLIVNDRVDVALALDAEGVHVGQDDMPAPLARDLIGPHRILGVSAGTVEEARRAQEDGADYLGVGDVYGTPSKADAGLPIGVEGIEEIAGAVSIPVVGIGGITADNAAPVIAAGAAGVAVISAVVGAADPEAAARRLRTLVRRSKRSPSDR
ncbi:MAG: thiamine phosphate synthase [Chloroflexota bacterium]